MTTEQHYDPITGEEARSQFGAQLSDIKQRLVELGSLVTENLRRAGEAMREGKLDLIPHVRETDGLIDARFLELEREVFETLARQQPVARDLRFLVSATRIIYEQERSGDLVVNCMNMLEREDGFPDIPSIQGLLSQAVDASARVFAMSVDAIADMDKDAATTIDKADDEVDDLISRYYTEIGRQADTMGLEMAIALTRVGRFLERIGDHGVNIGENVTYIVTAEMPRPENHHVTPSDEA
jgi:phosphate transport system protein